MKNIKLIKTDCYTGEVLLVHLQQCPRR